MIASEVASAKTPMGKISMKKLWEACRDLRVESRKAKTDTSIVTEAPIPLADDADIVKKWKDKHDVVLPDSQLLVARVDNLP